ncbi:MAG: GNAT family N-acetyltransferase [Nostoc sp.]|uniref:GNAT family N-acetyltransferase n=1 Tax=Nostoc sp. TaxID=1180 RepID=UPI002FFA0B0C
MIRNESGALLCTFALSNQLPDYYPEHLKTYSNIWLIKSVCAKLQETRYTVRKIIRKVIEIAPENQIKKIYLDCVVDNPILESYYQRYGFKRIAIAEHPRYKQNMVIMVFNI